MSSLEFLLAEQPLLVSLMLSTLAAGFIYGWLQTGTRQLAAAGVISALLVPGAWVLASRWQTDREQVEALIYEIAEAVENNDADRAVQVIGDPRTKERARLELKRWTFTLARVNKIRSIDMIEDSWPPEADVDMSVKVDVSQRQGSLRNVRVLRRLLLRLQKHNDDWQVIDYQHMPVIGGPDSFSTKPYEVPPSASQGARSQ